MIKIAGLIFILAASVAAQQRPSQAELDSAKAVMETLTVWADAVRDRDMKTLDRLFADDMVVTATDGSLRNKQEELAVLKPNANVAITSVRNDSVELRHFSGIVVVTGLTSIEFSTKTQKPSRSMMRFTAVFVKRDGRWQIAVLQATNLPKSVIDVVSDKN